MPLQRAQLNPHQQHFIATVNQNRVRYKEGLQRYKTRTYKHHWTYSRGKTYADIEQTLKTASETDVFYLEGSRSKEYTANALVVLPELSVVTPEEWHKLLEQTPETCLLAMFLKKSLKIAQRTTVVQRTSTLLENGA